ncbi:MFS transporter [Amycolatopsis acidicola]|uniref:MFS transporter n=1 Tax=Amycolatopsis acidicola TaxID=2596893 RepID=A0A5N0UZD0_9PSEU|nr:MFS transporter [Amycolatopsis acidicola]KAA9156951.1 MFS transporter [Amycolatopsis acidicola]
MAHPGDLTGRPETTGATAGPGTGRVLTALCLGLMLSMLNTSMMHIITPQIGAAMGASSLSGLQWVGDIYTLGYAALLLPGGALGNRIGRRAAFLGGVAVFAVGSLLCALAPVLAVLLVARVIQAIGVAVMLPQTLSILVHEYPEPAARARAVGIWAGVSSLGVAAGPVLGGVLIAIADWRAAFVLSLVLALAALVLGYRGVPGTRHGRPERPAAFDLPGTVLSAVWLIALAYGLIEVSDYGWGSPQVIVALVVAVLGAVLFCLLQARIARRGGRPLMPLHLWRVCGFSTANAAGLVYFLTQTGIIFFYNLYLQTYQHRSALVAGLLFLPMTVCMAGLAPVAGRLAARFGTYPVLTWGLIVSGIGCLALFLLPHGAALPQLEWRLALFGAGVALMSSPMSNAAVSSVSADFSGTASAVHNTSRKIGSSLGVALLGVLVHSAGSGASGFLSGLSNAMLFCAVLLFACAAAVFVFAERPARSH